MLATLYLAGMLWFGDAICTRYYRFASLSQRIATAFLVGLLLGSIVTYLGALNFAWTAQPLVMGNVVFLAILVAVLRHKPRVDPAPDPANARRRPPGKARWDWLCFACYTLAACWLMGATLRFPDGDFQFAFKSWSDFGANLAVSQSFLLGHNFPSEHPFFPGEALRYHFLFWFQAANLSFLGLTLVDSVNLLSVLSLLALLVLVRTLAELLFGSRAVGRIATTLFFFTSSSLSYIPFLASQPGPWAALRTLLGTNQFLSSGYPYRGEDWGALTVGIFANQRHLGSAIGILLVVLVYLVDRYQHEARERERLAAAGADERALHGRPWRKGAWAALEAALRDNRPLLFSGALIGLLPYWNSAVFVAACVVLGSLWLLFPCRRQLSWLIATVVLVGLPQVLMLRDGNLAEAGQTLFHWGYTIPDPTLPLVLQYVAWTFGFKWLLIGIALWTLPGIHARLFLALSSLVVVVFSLQLSTDAFNNHKLLNLWNIFATIYAAYALWYVGRAGLGRRALAGLLALAMGLGAIADFFPIRNDASITVAHRNDRLTQWLLAETEPSDVFLTHSFLTHPILFSGRKTFLGYTLFAWTAGYDVRAREQVYRRIFQQRELRELLRLLHENGIDYVGIDNDLRGSALVKDILQEDLFREHFDKVYEDTELRYANLTIYRVPCP